ncbi:alpha/beta hydrolase domain-containing protein [Bradyrhizobium lablabi]|uniref:alpha/beta hydrolase domain-containing protein n=1 Tax=Bradyrhizobium lablabi TaxID=722472 RepID=UPI0032E00152
MNGPQDCRVTDGCPAPDAAQPDRQYRRCCLKSGKTATNAQRTHKEGQTLRQGVVLPFAPTEAARKDANEPRPSIEARYADDAVYVAAVKREAARAVAERLLLEEDAVRSVEAVKQGTLAKLGQLRFVGWVSAA